MIDLVVVVSDVHHKVDVVTEIVAEDATDDVLSDVVSSVTHVLAS